MPTSSSSVPGPPGRPPPPPTSPAQAWTCCRSTSPPSRARRSAATASRRAAIKQIIDLGIDCSEEAGWLHNRGLRVLGGGVSLELDWPDARVRSRISAPSVHARTSTSCSSATPRSQAPGCTRTPPSPTAVTDERTGRVVGVNGHVGRGKTSARSPSAPRSPSPATACSARLALSVGITKRDDRPMGVAVRRYYRSPRTHDDYLESPPGAVGPVGPGAPQAPARLRLDLRDGRRHPPTSGSGILSHQPCVRVHRLPGPAPQLAGRHTRGVGLPRGERRRAPLGGAALPMGFNRVPHYHPGMLLVGDAGGPREPVQRRGHRLRDGVGRHRLAVRDPVAGPPRRRPRRRRWRATRRRCGRRSAATTASATYSPS